MVRKLRLNILSYQITTKQAPLNDIHHIPTTSPLRDNVKAFFYDLTPDRAFRTMEFSDSKLV